MILKLPNVTVWSCVWNGDAKIMEGTLRVLRYCSRIMDCERVVLFSNVEVPPQDFHLDVVRIKRLDMHSWNVFVNREVPKHITSDFAMSVHEDGFPLYPSMWDSRFLDYDYIGAPWQDLVVGNGGFNIESKKLMQLKMAMPFNRNEEIIASDEILCRHKRNYLEQNGIRFAPAELAFKFSTETIGNNKPSFGFHGRKNCPEKYRRGWSVIENCERGGPTKPDLRVAVAYLRIVKKSDPQFPVAKDYESSSHRWLQTYLQYKPHVQHDVLVVNCGDYKPDYLLHDVSTMQTTTIGGGYDCGTYQEINPLLLGYDLVVAMNTHAYFDQSDWLEPFIDAARHYGPGLYGATASYENFPHLRTPCIAYHPQVMRLFGDLINTRDACTEFESGKHNFSLWALDNGFPTMLVTKDGAHPIQDWRSPPNIFRRGDQSNVLIKDRHTEVYALADAASKQVLEHSADTLTSKTKYV